MGHLFDWSVSPPQTSDPQYADRLERGEHNRVFLDGVDVGDVMRYMTGEDGWIEQRCQDNDGNLLLDSHGNIMCSRRYGKVEFAIVRQEHARS